MTHVVGRNTLWTLLVKMKGTATEMKGRNPMTEHLTIFEMSANKMCPKKNALCIPIESSTWETRPVRVDAKSAPC